MTDMYPHYAASYETILQPTELYPDGMSRHQTQ